MLSAKDAVELLESLGINIDTGDSVYRSPTGDYVISNNTGTVLTLSPASTWQEVMIAVNGGATTTASERSMQMSLSNITKLKTAVCSIFNLKVNVFEAPKPLGLKVKELANFLECACDEVSLLGYIFAKNNGIHVFNIDVYENYIEFLTQVPVAGGINMSFDDIRSNYGKEKRDEFNDIMSDIIELVKDIS